ncbi:ABC transporter ATP-binding protein [Anaerocolumna xylanovorans]|uniref:Putative ABC transport system ATP-binding protein n=1 Tax=Anaerocolumna xylanovorans DSM 12503 TaxID=1121345 RepID=A0A1M7Y5L7_9FIRM|nr:ABC transporter ATP-binding protein [Anaerocolumna xylanovorans]SHO47746.1 putative ABC transport system ATP-binding protein [Anaerocolumna xylanovorans DSM 12503]
MDIITAENVYKEYGVGQNKVPIIKNISLYIKEGEFVSVIGPSGSGKSTLLYLLSGMEPITDGNVRILGHDLSKITDKEISRMRQEKIGFIFQFYNLVAEMTVDDNILLSNLIGKAEINKQRLEELLDLVGLREHRTKFPNELSGGQQQRVAIARAVYNNPAVIFADEPTGNLDTKNSTEVMKLLKKINEKYNTTIIQVTHDEQQAKYANRILRIEDGEIVYDNTGF